MLIVNSEIKAYAPYIKFKNDITVKMKPCSSTLIKGVNGTGKSTLLTYIYKSYQNQYRIFYLTQELIQFHNITIKGLISLIGTAYKYTDSPYEIMQFLNVEINANRKFKQLSGGEQQKLMIAIAYCCDVDLLLLDEPFNNLDQKAINLVNELIANYQVPQLIVSHIDLPTEFEVMLDV